MGGVTLDGVEFRGNHSGGMAGGFFAQYTASIQDSLFVGNSADGKAGGRGSRTSATAVVTGAAALMSGGCGTAAVPAARPPSAIFCSASAMVSFMGVAFRAVT